MRNALLVLVLLATAACGAYRFPGPAGGSGTVSGQVIATAIQCGQVGPATQPCLPGPAAACLPNKPNDQNSPTVPPCGTWQIPDVVLVFTNGSSSLSATTDSNGDYSIELPAATWTVDTKPYPRIISGPRTLIVSAGASIVANYVVDLGIRAVPQAG